MHRYYPNFFQFLGFISIAGVIGLILPYGMVRIRRKVGTWLALIYMVFILDMGFATESSLLSPQGFAVWGVCAEYGLPIFVFAAVLIAIFGGDSKRPKQHHHHRS